jgi:SPP1 gp7 family putative phage head morphogenesis protein
MPTAIMTKTALTYAENRITHYLMSPWKRLRQAVIDNRSITYDILPEFQNAIMSGVMTAFLYGRIAGFGDIVKQTRGKQHRTPNRRFATPDWSQTVAALKIILKNDSKLVKGLLGIIGTKLIKNEAAAFDEYFRPSEKAMAFMSQYTVQLAGIEAQDTLKYVSGLIKDTVEQGMSESQATAYISNKITDFARARAKAIAITEATRAYNVGTLEECQGSTILEGYRFNAVLDMLTTDICRERNDIFIPAHDTGAIASNTPPLHVNCRSNLEPVTKYSKRKDQYKNINDTHLTTETKQRPQDIATVLDVLNQY